MLYSIISSVKPLFSRYSYSISGRKYWVALYFRRTKNRKWFRITLEQLDDHVVIDYVTDGFTDCTNCYSKKIAIEILSNYIKCGLNLFHNCNS